MSLQSDLLRGIAAEAGHVTAVAAKHLKSCVPSVPLNVEGNAQWQPLIAYDCLWELPYAPAIGHPARLSGREEVVRHVTWFLGVVENFRLLDLKVHALADPEAAVAEVKAEALESDRPCSDSASAASTGAPARRSGRNAGPKQLR